MGQYELGYQLLNHISFTNDNYKVQPNRILLLQIQIELSFQTSIYIVFQVLIDHEPLVTWDSLYIQ